MATTRKLAHFINELRYADLPDFVVEKAKAIALNSWGVQLAASTLPWSKLFYRYVRSQGGTPESTIVSYGLRTSAANAAYINGCFGHGFELDDNHGRAGIKGGCIVAPTGLAVGERQLSSGKDLITAMVAGFEVMTRVSLAARVVLDERGYQSIGTCGVFGAAVVAGKLFGLDEESMVHTLGIAGNQTAAWTYSEKSTGDRGHLKRTFGGMANSAGIRAALLAEEGLTGPEDTLDVDAGFARGFGVDETRVGMFTDGLGSDWEIMKSHFKIYAQDGHVQPITEALERIRKAHSFKTEDIEQVWLGTNKLAHDLWIGPIREPKDLTDAQYSANFSAALYLVKGGAGFREYTAEENLYDPEIRELSQRVVLEIDDELEKEFQRARPRGAKAIVRLKSGEEYKEQVNDLRAMTPEDLDAKFRELSTIILDHDRSEELLSKIRSLEEVRDVSTLAPLLVR